MDGAGARAAKPTDIPLGGLSALAADALMAAILSGWVAAVTVFPGLSLGNPGEGAPGCPWPLVNHGFAPCLSHARYQGAAAGGERALAGIPMFFFVTHCGVAASEVARHRP